MFSFKKIALTMGALLLGVGAARAELVGSWSFDDEAGSHAAQESVTGANAAVFKTGSASTDTSIVTFGNEGVFGGTSAKLNGGYLQLTKGTTDLADQFSCIYSGNYTVNLWAKIDSVYTDGNWTPIFGDWNSPHSYQFMANGSKKAISYVNPTGENRVWLEGSTPTIPTGEWAMLTFTLDRTTGTLSQFINGVPAGTTTVASLKKNYTDFTSIQFGAKGDQSGLTLKGSLDETKIYDTVLAQKQIQALMTTNDVTRVTLQLADLNGASNFAAALDGKTSNGTVASASNVGITKAGPFNVSTASKINLVGDNSATNGIFLDLTGQSALHGNINGAWGSLKKNVCANDDTALKAPAGYEFKSALGMHANSMITYDLNEIRDGFQIGEESPMTFSATAAMANCSAGPAGAVYSLVLLSSETDGLLNAWLQGEEIGFHYDDASLAWILDLPGTMPAQVTTAKPIDLELAVMPDADYLSLFLLTGTSSTCDHAMFLNASLRPGLPEPSTFALLALGLASGGWLIRRKKRV